MVRDARPRRQCHRRVHAAAVDRIPGSGEDLQGICSPIPHVDFHARYSGRQRDHVVRVRHRTHVVLVLRQRPLPLGLRSRGGDGGLDGAFEMLIHAHSTVVHTTKRLRPKRPSKRRKDEVVRQRPAGDVHPKAYGPRDRCLIPHLAHRCRPTSAYHKDAISDVQFVCCAEDRCVTDGE